MKKVSQANNNQVAQNKSIKSENECRVLWLLSLLLVVSILPLWSCARSNVNQAPSSQTQQPQTGTSLKLWETVTHDEGGCPNRRAFTVEYQSG